MIRFVSKYPSLKVAVGKKIFEFKGGSLVINDERVAEKLKQAKGYGAFFWDIKPPKKEKVAQNVPSEKEG